MKLERFEQVSSFPCVSVVSVILAPRKIEKQASVFPGIQATLLCNRTGANGNLKQQSSGGVPD